MGKGKPVSNTSPRKPNTGNKGKIGNTLPDYNPNSELSSLEKERLKSIGFGASTASDSVNRKLSAIPGVGNILEEATGLRGGSFPRSGRTSPEESGTTLVPKSPVGTIQVDGQGTFKSHSEEGKPETQRPFSQNSEENNTTINDLDTNQKEHDNTIKPGTSSNASPKNISSNKKTNPTLSPKLSNDGSGSVDIPKINWANEMEKEHEAEKCYESVLSTFKTLNLETSSLSDLNKSVITESKLSYWEGARDVISLIASLYHQKSSEAVDTITSCSLNTNTLVNSFKSDLELLHASIGNPKVDLANILKEIKDIKELVISNGASASRPSIVAQDRAESKITSVHKETKKLEASKVTSSALRSIDIALPNSPTWGQLRSHLIKLRYKENEAEKITQYLTKFQGGEKHYVYEGSIKILQEAKDKKELPDDFRKRLEKEISKK